MARRGVWLGLSWLFSLTVLGFGLFAVFNRQTIIDLWRIQTFQPAAEVSALAERVRFTNRGRDLFLASQPTLHDRETFNQHCTNNDEESIVLGCYSQQTIFLFNVTDQRLNGVEEVTAAHEMLHAAYERLSEDEKRRVNALLEPQIQAITDERLLNLIAIYNQHEPGELHNEMHSILGTERRQLSPELEEYYKQYFIDRGVVVGFSEGYERLFTESKQRLGDFDARLEQLGAQINANNSELEHQQQQLQAESARLDTLKATNQIAAYNQAVPGYNDLVRDFNALVAETRSLVDEHNSLVGRRNNEAAAQNQLFQGLDSRYQTLPQN